MHLEFCTKIYRMQAQAGRYFIHEHPKRATIWQEVVAQELAQRESVHIVELDMCAFGMTATDREGEGFVKKEARTLTSSQHVA